MIGTLRAVVLDAPDARRLAAFYTALGGWTEQYADDEWIAMDTGDGWRIAVQYSPGHMPPRWPDPAYPQQAHLGGMWSGLSWTAMRHPSPVSIAIQSLSAYSSVHPPRAV